MPTPIEIQLPKVKQLLKQRFPNLKPTIEMRKNGGEDYWTISITEPKTKLSFVIISDDDMKTDKVYACVWKNYGESQEDGSDIISNISKEVSWAGKKDKELLVIPLLESLIKKAIDKELEFEKENDEADIDWYGKVQPERDYLPKHSKFLIKATGVQ